MNDALKKITEATNAFNLEMARAGENFNRLAGAQEFLMAAVDAAQRYAQGEGNCPRVSVGKDIEVAHEAPVALEGHPEPVPVKRPNMAPAGMPRFLANYERPVEEARAPEPLKPSTSVDAWPWSEQLESSIEKRLRGNSR